MWLLKGDSKRIPQQEEPSLAVSEGKVYPQRVRGFFRRIKWGILICTLGIYYFLPFLRWDRGPYAPDQAVLVDFERRRFYFFFIELFPDEVYYFAGLLILAALLLFLLNAVAGRVWCGYLCPQTVWKDLFLWIEYLCEGDRRERIQTDKRSDWTWDIWVRRVLKHVCWLAIALCTGGAWVLYFADAPTLLSKIFFLEAPRMAYIWMGIFTGTTYVLGGIVREKVCLWMCPWPRIQAALTDEYALNITYRSDRGEPRMSLKAAERLQSDGGKAGDCIDCYQFVAVCPTGVDIRNGSQLGCIQCGLCVDACDQVMRKIGRVTGLIGYDTDLAIQARVRQEKIPHRFFRFRTVLYGGLIVAIMSLLGFDLYRRPFLRVHVAHDRNPTSIILSDGRIRNAYTLHIMNKLAHPRSFALSVESQISVQLRLLGTDKQSSLTEDKAVLDLPPGSARSFRIFLTSQQEQSKALQSLRKREVIFSLKDLSGTESMRVRDYFFFPN